MNNEETILDPQYSNAESQKKETSSVEQPKAEDKKSAGWGEKAAYAVGGAVVGAGVTMAEQAAAATSEERMELPEETEGENTEEQHAAPEPEDAIVATATGVRVAQVDDNASFSQAFADARAQVGPGGVFEWHGRVYGTYYKDEWDNMTAEEKHDYQASIDYKDVVSDESLAEHSTPHNEGNVHYTSYNDNSADAEVGNDAQDGYSEDVDVQVLEVGQTDLNGDGIPENAAVLEVNGREVLIVDIDQDGIADAALCDVDNDGEVEIADLSGEDMAMPDQSAGDLYLAQADAPDYMNDANVGMYEA